ncbi:MULTISPECIES: lysophospholipid acyltransferase family protein [unclassified Phyllobacterium]|uniref:lysophospholipid acyltransferase family protein n=1 Tax=Phyllobacterium TaxID=28100 RepID=UPI000DD8A88D|nr:MULTISPECIES: lysophospholipid acyltransferase family protein [unclassified Phyllobacterium]MBA8903809.1 hypothetical protein [Phyllobacterium sp. P30BS-XVII]UGX85049.1 lysophospholipid acyltransferase family protein [Phyllobacterium sp. T1293]
MMDNSTATAKAPRKKNGVLKRFWRSVRGPLAKSRFVRSMIVWLITQFFRLVNNTNPRLPGSSDLEDMKRGGEPFIAVAWHGQHLMAPFLMPRGVRFVAMFSKSKDAELNARVAERFGVEIIRGSGGREPTKSIEKGGVRALLALKKALKDGKTAAMIADIPHGTPRDSGLGVILLAKLSGRPIIPICYMTSRRKVLEKSWDKTTIPLPFGKSGLIVGDPIFVPEDADDAMLETKRVELTASLNANTARVQALVDGQA